MTKISPLEKVKVYSSFCGLGLDEFYFSGIAFLGQDVYMGECNEEGALSNVESFVEGRFFLTYIKNGKRVFKTDNTGQELVFYYVGDDGWAVSNSFKALVEHLSSHGVSLSVNYASLFNFQGVHSFCEALTTDETTVTEIRLLGCDELIEIGQKVGFSVVKSRLDNSEEIDLSSELSRYVEQWKARLFTLVESLPSGAVVCDLTGGVDSRLVLALLVSSGCDLKKINFVSNPLAKEDFSVASALAESYGLSLNKDVGRRFQRISSDEKLDLTLYSSLGVYHGFYVPRVQQVGEQAVHLHGGGGGLFRKVYNPELEKTLLSQSEFFPCRVSMARSARQLIKFDRRKVQPYATSPEDRSIRYFFETRNRYHFGRQWFKSLGGELVTPLISKALLDIKTKSGVSLDDRELYLLVFLMTTPGLLDYSFDKKEKNFSKSSIVKAKKLIENALGLESERKLGKLVILSVNRGARFEISAGSSGNRTTKKPSPQRLLYEKASMAWDTLAPDLVSDSTRNTVEVLLKAEDLSKSACRHYMYVVLCDFLCQHTKKISFEENFHEKELAPVWDKRKVKKSPTVENSAVELGLNVEKGIDGVLEVRSNHNFFRIKQNIILNGRHKQPLFLNKDDVKTRLGRFVNVPEGGVFHRSEAEGALSALRKFETAVGVIKPVSGVGGKGITTNLRDLAELKAAIEYAAEDYFILEEFYQGVDCRLYVVGGAVVAAATRNPPFIVGDGVHKISELIATKREERREKAYFKKHEITLSKKLYLELSDEDVPPTGRVIHLNDTGNISQGGESHDVTDILHPSFQDVAAGCWQAYGCMSDHFAVDLICEDISQSVFEQRYAILELNAKPGHGQHVYPYTGLPRRISDNIVNYWAF